jgi:putative peptidoglycan lipid II flippase
MLRRMLAGASGLSLWFILNQIPLWIERYYAAQLPTGSLSALGYAQRLFQLPLGMLTTVIMNVWVARVAVMPAGKIARQTFRLMGSLTAVTFPIAFVLALLARPVITLVYARGAFDAQAVLMTTGPFAMYALGLGFHSLSAVLVRTFQARGLVRYPLLAAVLDILLTFLLNRYAFQQEWGAIAIAAVNTIVASVRVLVLGSINHFLKAQPN